jgi:type I restriction enzyme S subunit
MAMALYKHWFVDFGPFQEGEFVDSELGLIPKGWEVKSVYSTAQFINGAAFKPKDFIDNTEIGLPVIKIVEIKQGITSQTKYSNKKLDEKYIINDNDILFPWSGNPHTSLGIHLWDKGKALLNQHIFVVRVDILNSKCFVFNTLKNLLPTFINLATHKQTTGLGHVTISNLKELNITTPDNNIIKEYESIANPILELIYNNQIESNKLTKLRDTLLPKLISGEVRLKEFREGIDAEINSA